jgi:single-stranded-DNA-specific exonuclease
MKWTILNQGKGQSFGKTQDRSAELKVDEVIEALLKNRGITSPKEVEQFINPAALKELSAKDLGLEEKEIKKAVRRIRRAIEKDESIIVYGDYDADGICATAILWEALYRLTKNVLPYIPERVSEGYGLNKESIEKLKNNPPAGGKELGLIITVDHGITAAEKIEFAKKLGVDVIVCDHHQPGEKWPQCQAVVHTDKVCAAAIAWFLAREILRNEDIKILGDYLDLVALASIADLEPLLGVNRRLVKFGLEALNQTKRCGLLAIMEEAGLKPGVIGTYEVGFIIAPRLNAMGRMEHALESLRLLCTPHSQKARDLAFKLGATNRERQLLTEETVKQALESIRDRVESAKLIFVGNKTYNQGVIGLVAGKLVEEFYRPAVVLTIGEVYSKASARSINGFNIIEAIRAQSELLVDAGGHPMAAGFTVETAKVEVLKQRLIELAEKEIGPELLEKTLKIDLELPLSAVSLKLWEEIRKLAPFGLGNPEPVFKSIALVEDFRLVGSTGKHLKLTLRELQSPSTSLRTNSFSAIAFNQGFLANQLARGQKVELAFGLTLNEWNGEKKLELKVKDIKFLDHGFEEPKAEGF